MVRPVCEEKYQREGDVSGVIVEGDREVKKIEGASYLQNKLQEGQGLGRVEKCEELLEGGVLKLTTEKTGD